MKKLTVIFLLLACQIASACMNTYQFKIFPVGVVDGKIITVDFKIRRTSQIEGNRWLKLNLKNASEFDIMWLLDAYISTYDQKQKLLSSEPIDSTYSLDANYRTKLQSVYQTGFSKIKSTYPTIELFKAETISFCDFKQKCKLMAIESDTINKRDYLKFAKKKHELPVFHDKEYFGFGKRAPEKAIDLYISSVRTYKTKNLTLVLSHLATGHEINMGMHDPEKEYKPDFPFGDIETQTYVEPLLHHGYGLDVFVAS